MAGLHGYIHNVTENDDSWWDAPGYPWELEIMHEPSGMRLSYGRFLTWREAKKELLEIFDLLRELMGDQYQQKALEK